MNDRNNIDVSWASEDTARRAVKDMPDLAVPGVAQMQAVNGDCWQ
jgi:hypothetical protein